MPKSELLKSAEKSVLSFLRTRTGFLGLGPTYGQIILSSVFEYAIRRHGEKSVVREAENILEEINDRNRMF